MVSEAVFIFVWGHFYVWKDASKVTNKILSWTKTILDIGWFQCFPMAYILELAGGAASDGYKPILDIVPDGLHVRSPIYLGNKEDVAEVEALIAKHESK